MSQAVPDESAHPRGVWEIAKRLYRESSEHYASVLAAAVSYNFFFALFPAMAAGVSMYGLIADAGKVERQLDLLAGLLPGDVLDLIRDQLNSLISASNAALGVSFLVSLLIALYSSTRGVQTLMDGLNIIHESKEDRGFIHRLLVALMMTVGAILFVLLTVSVVAVLPAVLKFLWLGSFAESAISVVRWPILAGIVLLALAVVYRFGPCRENPHWRWISWGAALATAVWLVASGGFSFYVARFGSYNETYGSVGAIMVVLIWLYITGYIVLLGAQLDAILEERTERAKQGETEEPPEKQAKPQQREPLPPRRAQGRGR
jgi:membrane protein